MSRPAKMALLGAVIFGSALLCIVYVRTHTIALLEPRGLIASHELSLMIDTILLMLIVAIPILSLTVFFGYWYRASNTAAMYTPDWEHNIMTELVWWAIPFEIILILGALTWSSTHLLDPHKKIISDAKPLTIQVVALPSAWLFIYPEQGIASRNELHLPVDRPIEFHITADAPMNSFWIPQLGGQIYAMTGMSTKLHLMADTVGSYRGVSANYSGPQFAGMKFDAIVSSQEDFDRWAARARTSAVMLDQQEYNRLLSESTSGVQTYASVEANLYDTILMKYMPPMDHH